MIRHGLTALINVTGTLAIAGTGIAILVKGAAA